MPRRFTYLSLALSVVGLACAPSSPGPTPAQASFLITNALVIDGTGTPGRRAAVRVEGDRIAAVGDLTPRSGERTINARGLVLAPGFIDTHSHADDDLFDKPDALAVVSQ